MESEILKTTLNEPIPPLKRDYNNFLDKTTFIFGGTGSGKTTICEDILYLIKDYVPNMLFVVPDSSSEVYKQKAPAMCIKEDLDKTTIANLWKRQKDATEVYNIANSIINMESVFKLVASKHEQLELIAITVNVNTTIKKINDSNLSVIDKKQQISEMEDVFKNKKIAIFKRTIYKYMSHLKEMGSKKQLTNDQMVVINYLDFNPRFCLVIDDKTENIGTWFSYFKKSEENPFEAMFFKNRWNYLTIIIVAHDDIYIPPSIRKNSRVTIYTTGNALVSSLGRTGNGFTNSQKKYATRCSDRLFSGSDDVNKKGHQKLCYIREDVHPFRYVIADRHPPFKLCSASLWELNDNLPKKKISENNEFINNLKSNEPRFRKIM